MKNKIIFTVALMCLATLPFYGQKLHAGLTTGLNVSTVSEIGDLYDNGDLKTGFGGGLSLLYEISPAWGIQTGLLYEQKGFRLREEAPGKISGTYNYLTLPLAVQGSFAVSENVRMYGLTGGYAAISTYSENALVDASGESMPSAKTDVEKGDYGWIIGGGIQLPAGHYMMQAGLKYSLGLMKVTDTYPDDRNKSLLVSVTLYF
jgi:hypothetical protein